MNINNCIKNSEVYATAKMPRSNRDWQQLGLSGLLNDKLLTGSLQLSANRIKEFEEAFATSAPGRGTTTGNLARSDLVASDLMRSQKSKTLRSSRQHQDGRRDVKKKH